MIRRSIEWIFIVMLGLLIVFNTVTLSRIFYRNYQIKSGFVTTLYRKGIIGRDPASPPEGYSSSGEHISVATYSRKGWVVRYTSSMCQYCRNDILWNELGPYLERSGYKVIILLPRSALDIREGFSKEVPQLNLVNMEWIKHYRLGATPTTVIFGRAGRVLWHHMGMLGTGDLKSAKQALENEEKS